MTAKSLKQSSSSFKQRARIILKQSIEEEFQSNRRTISEIPFRTPSLLKRSSYWSAHLSPKWKRTGLSNQVLDLNSGWLALLGFNWGSGQELCIFNFLCNLHFSNTLLFSVKCAAMKFNVKCTFNCLLKFSYLKSYATYLEKICVYEEHPIAGWDIQYWAPDSWSRYKTPFGEIIK